MDIFYREFGKLLMEYGVTENDNILEIITESFMVSCEKNGIFQNSQKNIIDRILSNDYKSRQPYNRTGETEWKKQKSSTMRKIYENINKDLSNLKLPHGLSKLKCYLEVDRYLSNPWNLDAYVLSQTGPKPDISISIRMSQRIDDKEEFEQTLKARIVHELVHARQIQRAKMKSIILDIPKLQTGKIKNKEMLDFYFQKYLMNPLEIEAYAVEYNYITRNKFDERSFDGFVMKYVMDKGNYEDNFDLEGVKPMMVEYKGILKNAILDPDNHYEF